MLLISEVTVKNNRITSFEKCSGFPVSSAEAAMMLSRAEFVTVYEVLMPPEEFGAALGQMTLGSMTTSHENGKLFLAFNKNNNHVNKRVSVSYTHLDVYKRQIQNFTVAAHQNTSQNQKDCRTEKVNLQQMRYRIGKWFAFCSIRKNIPAGSGNRCAIALRGNAIIIHTNSIPHQSVLFL